MATIAKEITVRDLPEAPRAGRAPASRVAVTVREVTDETAEDRRPRMNGPPAEAGHRAGGTAPKDEAVARKRALRERRDDIEASGSLEPFDPETDRMDR